MGMDLANLFFRQTTLYTDMIFDNDEELLRKNCAQRLASDTRPFYKEYIE